jgi:hypothetical protein
MDLTFVPAPKTELRQASRREVEVLLEDEPEGLIDGKIDLGALAIEFLVLGINPYPRKSDTVFRAPPTEPGSAGPFATLANRGKAPQPNITTGAERKKG